jgi:tetratricopeptide (TPR) repeat protein
VRDQGDVSHARTLLIATKAPETALDVLDKAFESQKRSIPFIVQRNWALLALGRRDEFRQAVGVALKTTHVPDLLIQDAILKFQEKNYSGAQSSLDEVLNQDPENVSAHFNLQHLYKELGEQQKSSEHFRLHQKYKPDDNARDKAVAAARQKYPAANHAAEAVVIYPLTRTGAPELPAAAQRDPNLGPEDTRGQLGQAAQGQHSWKAESE